MARKRVLLLTVAVLLSVSAVLAIAVLLIGRFGSTEGRILGSTALLGGFGLVSVPSVVLLDKERARWLALAGVASAALASVLALLAIWSPSSSDTLGRTVGSAAVVAVAFSQLTALTARRATEDPASVRRFFAASCVTAALAAILAVSFIWSNPHGNIAPRALGALVVLDLLLVALQPVLARARPGVVAHHFDVVLASGERVAVSVTGRDLASAAARAIRSVERERGSVVELDVKHEEIEARSDGAAIEPTRSEGVVITRSG
jgi:FtsH-binding integral membrane protein